MTKLTFDVESTFEVLWARQDVVAAAGTYSLQDPDGTDFGRIPQEEADFIQGAANYVEGKWDYTVAVEGNSFTFIAADAILTNDLSVNVDPEDTYLTDADDTINALTFLGNNVYIEDISQDDWDVLNATVGTAITPTIINIEQINVRSTANDAELDFGAIENVQLVTLTGTRNFKANDFDTAGDVEARLTTNRTFTLEAGTATADDVFNLSVEGSTGATGGFTFNAPVAWNDAIDAVTLNSMGTAKNIVTLAVDDNYNGIDALNLMGTAALDITTPYVADMAIDATGLTSTLNLGLVGAPINAAANDLSENITGEVEVLTLTDYGDNAGNLVETADIEGLTEVRLSSTNTTPQAIDVGVADGVEVSLIQADDGADENVVIVVDGADAVGADDSSLTYNVGGAADVVAGTLTAANIQNLSINSVGSAANSITDATTDALENLMVTADQDFTANSFSVFDGTATTTDIFNIMTAGDGDVALGTITTDNEVNGVVLENSGEGDRTLTLDDAGELKHATRGEGVKVEGDGTGTVVVTSTNLIMTGMEVDGTEYAGGELHVAVTGDGNVDTKDYTGVDRYIVDDATFAGEIRNLEAGTLIEVAKAAAATTSVTIVEPDVANVTERSVLYSAETATNTHAGTLIANNASTLNLMVAGDGNVDDNHVIINTLTTGSLVTLNVDADFGDGDGVLFNIDDTVTFAAGGAILGHDRFLNIEGDDNFTVAEITGAGNFDNLTISANDEGARTITKLDVSDITAGGSVTVQGDSDVTIAELALDAVGNQGDLSINLNSDADVTLTAFSGNNIADGATLTINSQSSDGEGENKITEADGLTFGDASILEITGNQKLIIGKAGNALDMHNAGNTQVLDASAFEGELELFLTRDATGTQNDTQTVKIGTGNTTVNINAASTAAADDDVFVFEFAAAGVGEVEIVNFADNGGGQGLDKLDLSNYDAITAMADLTFTEIDTTGNGTDDSVVITHASFDGEIQLTGVTEAQLAAGNFTFA